MCVGSSAVNSEMFLKKMVAHDSWKRPTNVWFNLRLRPGEGAHGLLCLDGQERELNSLETYGRTTFSKEENSGMIGVMCCCTHRSVQCLVQLSSEGLLQVSDGRMCTLIIGRKYLNWSSGKLTEERERKDCRS